MSTYDGFPVTDGVITYLSAPEGYEVDFENPQKQYDTHLYAIVGAGSALTLVFMYQRLYTKIFLSKGLQLDDSKCRLQHQARKEGLELTNRVIDHSVPGSLLGMRHYQ